MEQSLQSRRRNWVGVTLPGEEVSSEFLEEALQNPIEQSRGQQEKGGN